MSNIQLYPEGYYHIYNRGVDKRLTYTGTKDYQRFIENLIKFNRSNQKPNDRQFKKDGHNLLVKIISFCLMPNHYHLLLQQIVENGVSKFMQRIGNGYTKYFNIRHERKGCLYESGYQMTGIKTTEQLLHVTRYIHLNPLSLIEPDWKENAVQDWKNASRFLEKYPWSSYRDYLGESKYKFLHKKDILDSFGNAKNYKDYITSWATRSCHPLSSTSDVELRGECNE